MDKTTCPFLSGTYVFRCTAQDRVYVPTEFQINEYCLALSHKVCPFYRSMSEKKVAEVKI